MRPSRASAAGEKSPAVVHTRMTLSFSSIWSDSADCALRHDTNAYVHGEPALAPYRALIRIDGSKRKVKKRTLNEP
jgi:hypothetical protein